MLRPPLAKWHQRSRKRHAECRHGVIDHRRYPLVVVSGEHARRGELAQLLNQDLLAYTYDQPLELPKTLRTRFEVIQDQGLSLAAHHGERGIEAARWFFGAHGIALYLP